MTGQRFVTTIRKGGSLAFIYSDEAAGLMRQMDATVVRASHVEPFAGGWVADMRPSGGPILGDWGTSTPVLVAHAGDPIQPTRIYQFPTRAAALAAEVAWLRAHRGL